jgi:vacuolar iron transporter family protein
VLQLSRGDRLTVHARDELRINVEALANPTQASIVSALSFVLGAIVPILVVAVSPASPRVPATMAVTLVGLVALGTLGARLGGAPPRRAALRVLIGGALALLISLGIGSLTGNVV